MPLQTPQSPTATVPLVGEACGEATNAAARGKAKCRSKGERNPSTAFGGPPPFNKGGTRANTVRPYGGEGYENIERGGRKEKAWKVN